MHEDFGFSVNFPFQVFKEIVFNILSLSQFAGPSSVRKQAGCMFNSPRSINVEGNFFKSMPKSSIPAARITSQCKRSYKLFRVSWVI